MTLLVPLLLFLCQSTAPSGGSPPVGAPDGTTWTDGTSTVLSVADNTNGGVYTNLIDSSGFSQPVNAEQGADTANGRITATNSQTMNAPGGSGAYRVVNGKLCKRNSRGKWVALRRVKTPKAQQKQKGAASLGPQFITAGTAAPFDGVLRGTLSRSVFLDKGDTAPFDGMLCPADDVVGIPSPE